MRRVIRVIILAGVVGCFAGANYAQDNLESDDLEQTMTMFPVAEEGDNNEGDSDRTDFSSSEDDASAERADLSASQEAENAASESDMQRINLLEGEIIARSAENEDSSSIERDGDNDALDVIRNDAISNLAEINAISSVTGLLDGLLEDLLGSLL